VGQSEDANKRSGSLDLPLLPEANPRPKTRQDWSLPAFREQKGSFSSPSRGGEARVSIREGAGGPSELRQSFAEHPAGGARASIKEGGVPRELRRSFASGQLGEGRRSKPFS